MMRPLCLGVLIAAFLCTPAQAQMVCGDRKEIVSALQEEYDEMKTASGISGSGGLVELFVALSGSWTLLLTAPGGPTCLLGAGEDWETIQPVRRDDETPT